MENLVIVDDAETRFAQMSAEWTLILASPGDREVIGSWERSIDTMRREVDAKGEAGALDAIDQSVIHPNTLAVLQLRALQDIASAPNSKVVVPYEAAGLVGGAGVLVEALKGVGGAMSGATANGAASPAGGGASTAT